MQKKTHLPTDVTKISFVIALYYNVQFSNEILFMIYKNY